MNKHALLSPLLPDAQDHSSLLRRGPPVRGSGAGRGRSEGALSPPSLVSPSFTCLEPPHLANLTLENASQCLMQH
ncbi:hypothetical protein HPG69_006334 [Diceros bicornis minor]|uniref:Uncharacterized protein n=1 Tax=Diceros bicornis minor TaxID=77932 RepID=A0A7J7EYG0_DICBM|nr:hypothetical protein HPG69_006334 [Diceros bicornis minor]